MSYVIWFENLSKDSIAIAGGKGANLGEMSHLNLPIPPGFCVTAQTYQKFIEVTGIRDKIQQLVNTIDIEDTEKLQEVSDQIQKLVASVPMPEDMAEEIMENYELLGTNLKEASSLVNAEEVFVAVRSSATAEDLPSISEEEHILVTVDGKPLYQRMKDLEWLDPETQDVEIPALENNQIVWKRVSALYKHPAGGEKLYKIKTVSGREITISPNHSLLILDEANLQPKVAKVKDLRGNEKVPAISTLPLINSPERVLNVSEYVRGEDVVEKEGKIYISNNSNNWRIQHYLSSHLDFSADFAYFLGVYAAEGSTYKENHVLITNSDADIQKKIIHFLRKINLYKEQKINQYTIRVYCKSLVRLLHAIAGEPSNIRGKGKLSSVKKVPDFVFGWDKTLIGAFLQGAFDGDGGVESNGIGYSSTSPLLIGGLIKLLEMLSIEFSVRLKKSRDKHWHDSQNILIPAREAHKFRELIGFESKRKSLLLDRLINQHRAKKYHPEFKHTINISAELSHNIKEEYDAKICQDELPKHYCPHCDQVVSQSSSYKEKVRFYCQTCHKTYYLKEVIQRIEKGYKYYDGKGKFQKGMSPWNKGIVTGISSQKHFTKQMRELGLSFENFFNGSVRWDQIKNVEEIHYKGDVYDFTIPDVQNFAAGIGGIITHNSASFAGQQATFLNVKGKEKVVKAVQDCWASLFTARAIYYREKNNFEHDKVLICAVVQKMVNSEQSGIMFTINPATNVENEIVIEAIYGLGEMIVGGEVNPDLYIVNKKDKKIELLEVKEQEIGMFRDANGENERRAIPENLQGRQKINEKQIMELARLGRKIEEHYGHPQDIEWAVEKGDIYIVQARAVTTYKPQTAEEHPGIQEEAGKIILKGETAATGVYSGVVKIVHDPSELNKVQKGDVMVTTMTTPDMVPAMQRAGAIITNEGGMTCHAAIVSREMGTPCLVGTEHATEVLKDGEIVTVHASRGVVYEGKIEIKQEVKAAAAVSSGGEIVTATEIKVILDLPDLAQKAAATGADGVGLVRLEIMIANGGIHPAEYIRQGKEKDYVELLKNGIRKIAQAFKDKPVWIRCSDMRSDEYRNLKGGDKEPKETDPMIGWHGIRRLLDEEAILKAEFQAVRELHYEGLKNIGVMIPFVIRTEELRKAKEIMREVGLEPCVAVDFGVMVETPASCWIIEELCREGMSFVSFGTNDLTQLTLGIDRNNERLNDRFDEMHPAVLGEIARVIRTCKKYNVVTSICGQAGSKPKMAEFLVHQGVDSISANADAVESIRHTVARVEKKVMLEHERGKI